jgi:DNA-binding MarR family transcriptional regulator
MAVARQRTGLDPVRCELVFEHLDTATVLRTALHRSLVEYRLSDLQFGVLVALFALHPEPAAPADLAEHTAVSRAAITEVLVRLESLQFISRTRDEKDRRVFHVHLTAAGQTTVDEALMVYLRAAGEVARHIEPAMQPELLSAYRRLQQGAVEAAS